MPLIAQQIANVLNGVSQRPQEQRHSSQAEVQKNGYSSISRGLMKRPPLRYLGKLTSTITGWADAFVHSINRDSSERYHIAVANGDVFAYDALLATPVTVIAPSGKAYLTDAAGAGYRAVTVGDTTMIVNRGTTVKRGATKTAARKYEALVYIRQADFSTVYSVTINNTNVALKTVDQATPESRDSISTDAVASDLYKALKAETGLSGFTFTLLGSTIHIAKTDSNDFTLVVADGLADKGLRAVKGFVQSFQDLPARATNGFIVEITGDPVSDKDNFWVQYDDAETTTQAGVWRECPKPGILTSLDASTLPHRLTRQGHITKDVEHAGLVTSAFADVTQVAQASAVAQVAWSHYIPADTAIAAGTTAVVTEHNNGVKKVVTTTAQRFQVSYAIDTSKLELGTTATVTVYKNGVPVASRDHKSQALFNTKFSRLSLALAEVLAPPGSLTPERFLQLFATAFDVNVGLVSTDLVEVKLTYSTGVTPSLYRRARLSVSPVSLLLYNVASRRVSLNTAEVFPAGVVVDVVLGGTTFTHTVGSLDETAMTVGAALAALIDASPTYIVVANSPTNIIDITRTDNTDFTATVSVTFNENVGFHHPALNLVTNEHAGRTLKNLTDGSSGVVVSNTKTTITVASLTGGVDNRFQKGDICSVVGSGKYFVFEPCPWDERGVGDDSKWPSFVDGKINEVFFYQNRMGFTSGENVLLSAAGDLFNFFPQTATDLLDDDVIDVKSAHDLVSLFHSVVPWNEGLYLFSDNAWFLLSGTPLLSPRTVRLDLVGKHQSSPNHRPVVAGSRLYFSRPKTAFTEVFEGYVVSDSNGVTSDAINVTEDSPKYIAGSPVAMIGDGSLGILAVVSSANQSNLYVYSYRFGGNGERLQSSWSRWEFAAGTTIVGLDVIDGVMVLLTMHSDGIYIHTIDLDVALDTVTADEGAQYLDRRVQQNSAGVSVAFAAGTTTWTLPYTVATNGSEGTLSVVKRGPPVELLVTTRPAANQIAAVGDHTAASVYIGVLYEFRYKPSRLYYRNRNDTPETRGRLQIRHLDVLYHDTTSFDVVVTLDGRSPRTRSVVSALPSSGKVRVSIQSRNEYANMEIVNASPGVVALSGLDWEGEYSTISRRV